MKLLNFIRSKILYKLIVGFVFVSFFVGVVSYISLTTISGISYNYNQITEISMPLINQLEEMKFSCLRLVSSATEFGFIQAESNYKTDSSSITHENELMQGACLSCHSAFKQYQTLVKSSLPESKREINFLKKKSIQLHKTIKEFIDMKTKGVSGIKSLEKKEEMEVGEMEFLEAIDSVRDRTFKIFETQKKSLENTITSSFKNILFFTGLTFLLSVLIGILYSRSISKPIIQLTNSTKNFSEGNYSSKVEVNTSDEIGILSSGFNEMAEKLKLLIHQLESELEVVKQTEEEITSKNAELSKSNSEKNKFFSIIAHDLRSPLHGLMGLTELISNNIKAFTEEELEQYSKHLHASALNLYKLIENLFTWAQMQRGSITYEPKEFVLNNILHSSIETIHLNAAQKEITIKNEIVESINIFADEKMIETVLRNLLSNAIKFTKRNGQVVIKLKKQESGLVDISICDNGVGIPGSKINKLFKIEEKIGSKGTEGELSTGLGLLLCKEFVEKNGGKIWVESEWGKGSVFTFSLPTNCTE
ncbi:MAG: HAMP domain-containing sensor histidine kinase [Ignavibacteriaceae bacterium]